MSDEDAALAAVRQRIAQTFGAWGKGTSLDRMRADFEGMLAEDGLAPGTSVDAGGVPGEWIGEGSRGTILFLHGGGYQIGSVVSHRGLMTRLAAASSARVLGIDYRLAPENRYPAALEDAMEAYRWLRDQLGPAAKVAVAGDSAGGGLTVALLLKARDEGLPMPACAALMSPWLDMEASGESFESRAAVDPMTQRAKLLLMARAYLGRDGNPCSPYASPLRGDPRGLPPILIHVGDHETILDDSRVFAERAARAGVAVDLKIWDRMIHHFQVFPELAAARQSIAEIGAFLARHLSAG
jgi:acetyl esterase/lipase